MGIFKTEDCPICGKRTNAFKKVVAKYNGKHLCHDCCTKIIRSGINAIDIKKKTLSELQRAAKVRTVMTDTIKNNTDAAIPNTPHVSTPSLLPPEAPKPIEIPADDTPHTESIAVTSIHTIDDYNVPLTDIDGKEITSKFYMRIDDDTHCLVTDGGKSYHLHVGCYKNWLPEYRDGFKGWKVITIADAEAKGLKKCAFCYESDQKESSEVDWDMYKNESPVKTFTVTHSDMYADADSYPVGIEAYEGFDVEKDRQTIEIDYETICAMPKTARDFFDENIGEYRMFVLKSYENDDGKVKIKIGIYERV